MKINDVYFYTPAHLEIAKARYFLKDSSGNLLETDIAESFKRETDFIYQNDSEDHKLNAFKNRCEKKALPAGRPLAQAGTSVKNMYNCFVLGFKDDTREAISELKRQHFHIQSQGGGTGFDFSVLRPEGSYLKTTQGHSSGAVGFITDISYQASNTQQSGNRSGANLALLHDWHPDLYDFIFHKSQHNWENLRHFALIQDEGAFSRFQWNNHSEWQMFNVSVALSDAFMQQVLSDSKEAWHQTWNKTEWFLWDFEKDGYIFTISAPTLELAKHKALSKIPFYNSKNFNLNKGPYCLTAVEWFNLIAKNAHEDGCPGVIFIDVARKFHNGEYFAPISAANPCGEQVMPANSACNLTSLVLPSFWKNGQFDYEDFEKVIHETVRGLDNLIDLNHTGEKEIDSSTRLERRIGIGTTGVAELLLLAKLKYSSEEGRQFVASIMELLRNEAYTASINLAKERGAFAKFSYDEYSKSEFFKTLPLYLQNDIKEYGIRNVTILTQAPVGSTGTMIGISQGCEPYYAMMYSRNSKVGSFYDGSPAFKEWLLSNNINYAEYDYNLNNLKTKIDVPSYFEEAHTISWLDHLKMQAIFSHYVDSSVSKTVNLPNEATIEDVKECFLTAYKLGIKSTTIYRDGSKQQILEHIKSPKLSKAKRPTEVSCDIHHITIKGEKWIVLVGLKDSKPYEVFASQQDNFELSKDCKTGKIIKEGKGKFHLQTRDLLLKDISARLISDEHRSLTRLLSLSMRHGVPLTDVIDQLDKANGTVVDFSKAILRVLKKYSTEENIKGIPCFKCGSHNIIINSGCPQCLDCGYSKCG